MTWVTLGSRKFIVDFDEAGEPIRIKERKLYRPDHRFLAVVADAPYWHARHHRVGNPRTLVARILEAAKKARHAV